MIVDFGRFVTISPPYDPDSTPIISTYGGVIVDRGSALRVIPARRGHMIDAMTSWTAG